jgi:hypothetical protein
MRRALAIVITLFAVALLAGCEQFFTSSPFSFMQRDPSTLPMDQRISYAKLALEGGDAETQRKAYEAIKDNSDPEVQLLASKVAVGASGLNDAIADAASALLAGGTYTYSDFVGSIDVSMLTNSVNAFANADGNTTISEEEYLIAAAASAVDLVENGPATDLNDALTSYTAAGEPGYYLAASGYTEDEITSLVS